MQANGVQHCEDLKMRRYIATASVDLIYLSPVLKPNRDCGIVFLNESGNRSDVPLHAVEDTRHSEPFVELVQTISKLSGSASYGLQITPTAIFRYIRPKK
jgi:hypothetical protein